MSERIHLDCNPIARERIMPHANPEENNPSDVLKRYLLVEQLTYAQLGELFNTNRGRIGVWVERGDIPPPTYSERALKRWKGWKEQGRDPLHTSAINARRAASVQEYYKNNPEAVLAIRRRRNEKNLAARAQNPIVPEAERTIL